MEELEEKIKGHELTGQQLNDKIAQLKSKLADQVAVSGEHVNQNNILFEKLQLKTLEHQKLFDTH